MAEPAEGDSAERLTTRAAWDAYWKAVSLPREYRRTRGSLYLNQILDVFDRHLPRGDLRAIELGGAPGHYLAYLHRSLGYRVACLDYSRVGCAATRENFRLLGIPGEVIEADLLGDLPNLEPFDVVYSLGLIEHFADPSAIVARHVELLRRGGHLVVGVPNFRGVNAWFMRRLAPTVLAEHRAATMDLMTWVEFERRFGLEPIFKAYVGGFEPSIFRRRENRSARTAAPYAVASVLSRVLSRHFGILRRLNAPWLSGYAMAVYRLS